MKYAQCEKKNETLSFLLCVLPLQETGLFVGLFRSPSAGANLHILRKTFTLTHLTIDRSRFAIYSRLNILKQIKQDVDFKTNHF